MGVLGAGRVPVIVAAGNVDGLRIPYLPGRARFEKLQVAVDSGAHAAFPDFSVRLASEGLGYTVGSSYQSAPSGHYLVVRFSGISLIESYVKAAKAGDADILQDGLTAAPGASIQIAVVLAQDGAKIEGVVLNEREPEPGADVVLAPDERSRAYLFKNTKTDQHGHFEFTAVPPGSYKVFALDDPEPEIWYDPDFLRKYEKQGSRVTVEPKVTKVIELGLAVRPDPE